MGYSTKRLCAILGASCFAYFVTVAGLHRAYPTIVMPAKIDASTHQAAIRSVEAMMSTLDANRALQLQTSLAIIGFDGLTQSEMEDPMFDTASHTFARLKTLEGMNVIQITQHATSLAAAQKQRKFLDTRHRAPKADQRLPSFEAPPLSISATHL